MKIKIFGGNGTVAGTAFLLRLSEAIARKIDNGENRDEWFPDISYSNFAFKMNHTGFPTNLLMDTTVFDMLLKEEAFDIAAFACNTAHGFYSFDDRFVNFIEAGQTFPSDYCFYCSRYSSTNKIFDGITKKYIYPSEGEQSLLDQIIGNVATGKPTDFLIKKIERKPNMVFACTELSYAFDKFYGGMGEPYFTTDDVVIKNIIERL